MNKKVDLEISSNYKLLFDKNITANEMILRGHKIGDKALTIDFTAVNMTGLEKYPKKIDAEIWRDNKSFVVIDGKEIEFTLAERINSVVNFGGWLGYADGSRFRIKDGKIDSFSLHLQRLEPFHLLSKDELLEKFGKAEKINQIYEDPGGSVMSSEYIYSNRGISISWNEWDNKIVVICLGKLVNEKEKS